MASFDQKTIFDTIRINKFILINGMKLYKLQWNAKIVIMP
jgi:hypothetical protein